jgi:hypothetical protein
LWDATLGNKLLLEHAHTVEALSAACGTDVRHEKNGENVGDTFKDITDALSFDIDSDFPLPPKVSPHELGSCYA